jgi:hypothetical protein
MVRVSQITSDQAIAWRIRDEMATHPLLGGPAAKINVIANHDAVILEGWTHDDEVRSLAIRRALRAAGHRPVQPRLRVQHCLRDNHLGYC